MKMYLHAEKTIKEVNREFSAEFPFLRLAFFTKPHSPAQGSPRSEQVPASTQLIDVTGVLREVVIEIHSNETVKDLEQRFQEMLGLPVQVFRKQKDVWIETIHTDKLTLEQQNEKGKEASRIMVAEGNSWDYE